MMKIIEKIQLKKFFTYFIFIMLVITVFLQPIVDSEEIFFEKEPYIWLIIISIGDIKRDSYGEESFSELLIKKGVPDKNIKKLIEENATKQKILNDPFDWLINNDIKEEDIVIFFFSMHGGQIQDQYPYDEADGYDEFIVPFDYNNKSNYILDEELNMSFNSLELKNLLLIFETCYSGGMIDGEKDLSFSGRVIITSSKANESSWPMYLLNRWLFPNFLFKGLSGPADLNNDMKISAEEAYKYAEYPTIKRSSIFAFIYSLIPFIPHEFSPQHPQIFDGWPSIEDNNDELNIFYI